MLGTEKDTILDALLPIIPFEGWTARAFTQALQSCNLDEFTAYRTFPKGVADAADYFVKRADQRMLDELATQTFDTPSITKKVSTAILTRLKQNLPYREAVRRALAFYALPNHATQGLVNLYQTVDAIWYFAGDTATDFNFYTKRAMLAGVYSTTLLFWLNDKSENQKDTEAFLARRLGNIGQINRLKQRILRSS